MQGYLKVNNSGFNITPLQGLLLVGLVIVTNICAALLLILCYSVAEYL
jgi:hypothetical protein